MIATVQKWGNSLAVRIPRSYARDISLDSGGKVNMRVHGQKLVIEPESSAQLTLHQLLKNVSSHNIHREIDAGSPTGNEVW